MLIQDDSGRYFVFLESNDHAFGHYLHQVAESPVSADPGPDFISREQARHAASVLSFDTRPWILDVAPQVTERYGEFAAVVPSEECFYQRLNKAPDLILVPYRWIQLFPGTWAQMWYLPPDGVWPRLRFVFDDRVPCDADMVLSLFAALEDNYPLTCHLLRTSDMGCPVKFANRLVADDFMSGQLSLFSRLNAEPDI